MATTKKKTPTPKKPEIAESSGNVFADLGFANPEQEQLKADLTLQIYRTLKARGLTQSKAGDLLGVKQPHVSNREAAGTATHQIGNVGLLYREFTGPNSSVGQLAVSLRSRG